MPTPKNPSEMATDKPSSQRVQTTVSCRDTDEISKVPNAGDVVQWPSGERLQVMHNGVLVLADAYYDKSTTEIIRGLRGHHEPQEEKVFAAVLNSIGPHAVMVELGAYWSYYSLWFQHAVANAVSYMIEPIGANLECGRRNFALNGRTGKFIQASVGGTPLASASPPTITVDSLVESERLRSIDLLHSDIQGHEYEMLLGCEKSIAGGKIRFIFISTHGIVAHFKCLAHLKRHGFFVIASHTPPESYSVDGLIAATTDRAFRARVPISKKPVKALTQIKSLAACAYTRWF